MKQKYLIFDFDGVLMDSFEAALEAHITTKRYPTTTGAYREILRYASTKPLHTKERLMTQEEEQVITSFLEDLKTALLQDVRCRIFEGFIEELKPYASRHRMAISSANHGEFVRYHAQKIPLPFSHILGYQDHRSKEIKIERICADWGVSPSEIYYFTDTLADVYELEGLLDPTKIIGCAWGYLGYEWLRSKLPVIQILKEYKDIHRIVGDMKD